MASAARKPLIGVTMGDPCGVGPEVLLRALANRRIRASADFVLFGSDAVLRRVADAFGITGVQWRVSKPLQAAKGGDIPLIECRRISGELALSGKPTAVGGRASVRWIERATRTALSGAIDAMVTAPISKEAIHLGGHDWPGHTELIAHLCGVEKPVMMMAGGGLRIALVTTHVSITDLPGRITMGAVLETIRVTDRDLKRRFGIAAPRLAVCGLNPHAGEAGRFGSKEATDIFPAVCAAQDEGIDCVGPLPADTLFFPSRREQFDAVVAMYHDQACIPVKMLAFDTGVNVTLGLPIIRTSPDHGTAYDISRRGTAHSGSMETAILMAADMARKERSAK